MNEAADQPGSPAKTSNPPPLDGIIRSAVGVGLVPGGVALQWLPRLVGRFIQRFIALSAFCVRFIKSQLNEIASADLRVMAGAFALLATAALVAAMIPARRAASIYPMDSLRMD